MATLLAASILIFAVIQILPGDAATAVLQQQASNKKVLAAMRHQYGLDRPAPTRYLKWIEGAVQGDFGKAPASGVPVTTLIGTPLK